VRTKSRLGASSKLAATTAAVVTIGLAAILLLLVFAVAPSGSSQSSSQAPIVVSIQTLVNAYSDPNDIQCSANAKCPSEDALYKDKLIQTSGLAGSAGATWDSAAGEYLVSLYAPSGGSALIVVYFAKDSGVNPNNIVAGMNLTVAGTFGGLQPSRTGSCPLHCLSMQNTKLVSTQSPAAPAARTVACGPAEAGSCGI